MNPLKKPIILYVRYKQTIRSLARIIRITITQVSTLNATRIRILFT